MKTIACLGWGSLVWEPRELPTRGIWFQDGPLLPIEFARQSQDDRITLVIVPQPDEVVLVRSLWTLLNVRDLREARVKLKEREGTVLRRIATWSDDGDEADGPIGLWARRLGLDGVVWTALPPKFGGVERMPSLDEIIMHLRGLPAKKRRRAAKYIRNTPTQIATAYRRGIEDELEWRS